MVWVVTMTRVVVDIRVLLVLVYYIGLIVVNHGRDLIQETIVLLMLFGHLLICMDVNVDMNPHRKTLLGQFVHVSAIVISSELILH